MNKMSLHGIFRTLIWAMTGVLYFSMDMGYFEFKNKMIHQILKTRLNKISLMHAKRHYAGKLNPIYVLRSEIFQ